MKTWQDSQTGVGFSKESGDSIGGYLLKQKQRQRDEFVREILNRALKASGKEADKKRRKKMEAILIDRIEEVAAEIVSQFE